MRCDGGHQRRAKGAVLGLGFAATRDIVAFLRRDGSAANPIAQGGRSTVERAYTYGQSQSGRYLREFLYLGFNEDMTGRAVFDGMLPHIGGARFTGMNMRFGLPGRNTRHPQDPAGVVDRFPFTYTETTDPFTGARDSLMKRCRTTSTCPKVIQADSEYEWWGSKASLLVTDLSGRHLELPADVRRGLIGPVPPHLRDSHYSRAADLGHGVGYVYPHDDQAGVVAQRYLPDDLADARYYRPAEHGAEARWREVWQRLRSVVRGEASSH